MSSIPPRIAALVVSSGLFWGSPVYAEEEVRISIASNKSSVSIEAPKLAVFDADVGDRLARGTKSVTVEVEPKDNDVIAEGEGLVYDNKKTHARGRRIVFESEEGIRVDGRLYLGRVTVQNDRGRLTVINRLPLETYLLGIVGSEMSPLWPGEALKAQAVAARTYAMQRRMRRRAANKRYDLESTVLSQVYKGADRIAPSVIEAVRQTRGEVVSFKHQLAETLFHSTCGGQTVSAQAAFGGSIAYLNPRTCEWCRPSSRWRWKASMPLSVLSKKLQAAKLVRGNVDRIERREGATQVAVRAGGKVVHLSAASIRQVVGYTNLYSSRFSAETKGSNVHFEGRGFGHGVGMCQWGARGLSTEGRNYREILGHYYKGAGVKRLY